MTFSAPDWATYELVAMRVLVVALVLRVGVPAGLPLYDGQRLPVGLARVMDLSWLHRGDTLRRLRLLIVPFGALYVLDVLPVVGLAYLAGLTLLEVTYANSQGAVNHGRHLLLVALLADLAGRSTHAVVDALEVDPIDGLVLSSAPATGIWWALQAMLAVYFVSGVSKAARSDFWWIQQSPRFAASMVNRATMARQDRLGDTESHDRAVALAQFVTHNRVASMAIFGSGLAVELFAPVALVNRWTLVVGGLALIALHFANGHFLHLGSASYRRTLIVYFVNVPFLVVEGLRSLGVSESVLPG